MASHLRQLMAITLKDRLLTGISAPIVQSVRHRKPRWVPKSKSKEFYVREPTPRVPEEYEELNVRYPKYRAEVESIRQFLKQELSQEKVTSAEKKDRDETAEFQQMAEQVQEWNNSLLEARSKRLAQKEHADRTQVELLLQRREKKRQRIVVKTEKQILKAESASKDFISSENLDEAIEKMLDSRSDYNFAITKSGEVIKGEYPDRSEDADSSKTQIKNQT